MKRLKKFANFGLGALFAAFAMSFAMPALALEPQEYEAPVQVQEEATGPALWRVADEDTTIFLFGTVHALPPDTVWLDDRIENALLSSGEFVTEVDMAEAKQARPDMLQRAFLPEGISLRALLREDEKSAFDKAMTGLGLPPQSFDRFKPWYAAMMLSLLPLAQNGYGADSGAEAVLEARLPPGSRRKALESVTYQLDLFDSLPAETQIAYLVEVSKGAPEMNEQLGKMIEHWRKGDADGLAALLNEETSDPVLLQRLLIDRNRNWADWIAKRLDRPGTIFIAVGAGHLAGQGSVQDMLALEGIAAARVR